MYRRFWWNWPGAKREIEEAILSLERLARGRGRRRAGRQLWPAEPKKAGRPLSKNKSAAKTAAE
jgi:hypothetical protein